MARPFILIGLSGRARSGKDTAAAHLVLRFDFYRYAFAKPLKDGLRAMFQLTHDHLEGELKERPLPDVGRSPRELMQTLGTEWGRQMVHPDLWLLLAERAILAAKAEGPGYLQMYPGMVVSDVRFENEAALIRRLGGTVIHLIRPEAPGVRSHSSEQGIAVADGDLVIRNDSNLAVFTSRLNAAGLEIIDRARREHTACA